MNYPIPPWLSPNVAQGYGELAQRAASIGLENEMQKARLSQQAQQFAVETQQRSQQIAAENAARQEELAYQHQVEQTKMQVEQAYKQQQLALDTQAQGIATAQWQQKVQDSADKAAALRRAQKAASPKEMGGEGLSFPEAYLREVAPYMTGTEVGRLAMATGGGSFTPGKVIPIPNSNDQLVQTGPHSFVKSARIPETMTAPPIMMSVTNAAGQYAGDLIQVPGQKPIWRSRPKLTAQEEEDQASAARRAALTKASAPPSTTVDAKKPTQTATNAPESNEVIRMTKTGRPAVFDSKTKKFLRWAGEEPAQPPDEPDNAPFVDHQSEFEDATN
jgi:hypothetical protein